MPRKNKTSRKEYAAWYRANQPEATKRTTRNCLLKRNFGITIEDYNKLFERQQGKCAVCGKHQTEFKKRLAVDHCHKTKKVRGLLCNNCNIGIGFMKDDIENLKCAILYLNKH